MFNPKFHPNIQQTPIYDLEENNGQIESAQNKVA